MRRCSGAQNALPHASRPPARAGTASRAKSAGQPDRTASSPSGAYSKCGAVQANTASQQCRANAITLPYSDSHIALALGWLTFAVVVQRARGIQGEGPQFDPFEILGVSSVSRERDGQLHRDRRLIADILPAVLVREADQEALPQTLAQVVRLPQFRPAVRPQANFERTLPAATRTRCPTPMTPPRRKPTPTLSNSRKPTRRTFARSHHFYELY